MSIHVRTLPDGCLTCGLSVIACDASEYVEGVACCEACDHRTPGA